LKNPFKIQKRTTVDSIETEMATLAKRRAETAARVADIHTALDEAKAERREILSSDGDLGDLSARIRSLTVELSDLESVLEDIDTQGEDAATRLLQARDADERAASAAALEKKALAAEQLILQIEKAVAAFAKPITALKEDLRDLESFWWLEGANRPEGSVDTGRAYATGREIATAVAAEALARALPWAFDLGWTPTGFQAGLFRIFEPGSHQLGWRSRTPNGPLSIADFMEALVCGRLRKEALTIKAGDTIVDEGLPSMPPNVTAFVVKSFSYIATHYGPPVLAGAGWVRSLPQPVAKLAEKQGLAVEATSPEGRRLFDEAKNIRQNRKSIMSNDRLMPSDCIALGDVMGLRAAPREISGQGAVG
jgi:hypothetical protein